MADHSRPDLCIVGAGALGIALALHARRLGASVTLVDRGPPEPGDGPQQAARVAALQASAARAEQMRGAAALGLAAADPSPSLKAVQERARQVAAARAPLDGHERLTALGIAVVSGAARFLDPRTLAVGDTRIRAGGFVLAVGARPLVPALPGLEEAGYFTPDTILDNTRKLTHLLVIGGDAAGFALAQAFARLGSEVTLVPQGGALAGHDAETAGILLDLLAGEGVRVEDGGVVRAIQPRSQGIGVLVELPGRGEVALDLSHILLAAGAAPDIETLAPEAARLHGRRGDGSRLAPGPLGRTANRRVRVVGAAAGIDQWHHALSHGRAVVETMVLGLPRRRPGAQPLLVMTDPALAQIGRLAGPVDRLHPGHGLHRGNFAENDQARALGREAGLIKVLTGPQGRIMGASLVGPGAAELAGMLAMAMDRGIGLDALAGIAAPHPSLAASLVALGEDCLGDQKPPAWAKRLGALRRLVPF